MKTILMTLAAGLTLAGLVTGCDTIPPGAERGPHNTMAYDVLVDASAPGARIEANGAAVGNTPVHLKIFGDPDGTFHDFGSYYYLVRAFPLATNQFPQIRMFRTGRGFAGEDMIPQSIYFDMNQKAPVAEAPLEPRYGYPYYYGPPYYYYGPPYFYGPPYYYGPSFRVYVGPGHRR